MNFNDDDSIINEDISDLRDTQFSNFNEFSTPPFPNPINDPNNFSNLNIGPPPGFTPSKDSPGVKVFDDKTKEKIPKGKAPKGKSDKTKAVSPGSISFCLFKFTYIWERGKKEYWCFLLNVDRKSVSGLRWFRGTWVYFGLDINKIDSFVCYRVNDYYKDEDIRKESLSLTKKEFKSDKTNNIYSKVLSSVQIPEERNDFLIDYLGEVDENNLTVKVPCKQRRSINYRIVLEIKYPESFNKTTQEKINSAAIKASNDSIKYLDEFRDSERFLTPFEVFNISSQNINKYEKVFSEKFNSRLKKIGLSKENTKAIEYSIIQEKLIEPWRII